MFVIPPEFNVAFVLLSILAFCLTYFIGRATWVVLCCSSDKLGFRAAGTAGALWCVLLGVTSWLLFSTSLWSALWLPIYGAMASMLGYYVKLAEMLKVLELLVDKRRLGKLSDKEAECLRFLDEQAISLRGSYP